MLLYCFLSLPSSPSVSLTFFHSRSQDGPEGPAVWRQRVHKVLQREDIKDEVELTAAVTTEFSWKKKWIPEYWVRYWRQLRGLPAPAPVLAASTPASLPAPSGPAHSPAPSTSSAVAGPSTSTSTGVPPGSRKMPSWVSTPPARCAQCRKMYPEPRGPFHQVCTGCFYQSYCSRACQELHWEAGHKDRCALLRARTAAAAAAAKAAGDVYK